jgi:hypothetical protein
MFAFYRKRAGDFKSQLEKLFQQEEKIVAAAVDHIDASKQVINILSEEIRQAQEVISVVRRVK